MSQVNVHRQDFDGNDNSLTFPLAASIVYAIISPLWAG